MSCVSIVVPSYRRPERLAHSLSALQRQRRPADEIIVVHRGEDAETRAVAKAAGVVCVAVDPPGVLAAMRAGARMAGGDCIGFFDDDAEAREDWLDRALAHLADPRVGGVCGRDIVDPSGGGAKPTSDVGRVTAVGKLIGNHHLGVGQARDVSVLKAADMLFRRPALALPSGLRGTGAQVHFEVATSLWAIAQGWRLVYDPALVVDHRAGRRFDEDVRGGPSARATANAAYNFAVCLGSQRPRLRHRRLVYGLLVGDRASPGVVRAARALLGRDTGVLSRALPAMRGEVAGYCSLWSGESVLSMHVYPSPGVEVAVR